MRQAAEADAARHLAEQEAERQAAAVQAALAVEPFYHDPPRHIDIDAAIRSIEDQILQERMRRLDELANNMSSSRNDEYHAQVAAQGEQIQRDREMAATLAADYGGQRSKREAQEEESDDDEYNDFGRVSPLVFPAKSDLR